MADVPVLVCTSGSLEGNRYTVLDGSELSIGRSDENQIVLTEDGVSRFHARLHNDNGALWLRDAGSRNGVFVNDLRVTDHHALRVGDVIRIADTEFTVRWLSDDEDTASFHGVPSEGGRWWWPFKS